MLSVYLLSYFLRSVKIWVFSACRSSKCVKSCRLSSHVTGACSFIRFAYLGVLPTTTSILILLCLWSGVTSFLSLSSWSQISLICRSRLHQAWSAPVGQLCPSICPSGFLFIWSSTLSLSFSNDLAIILIVLASSRRALALRTSATSRSSLMA